MIFKRIKNIICAALCGTFIFSAAPAQGSFFPGYLDTKSLIVGTVAAATVGLLVYSKCTAQPMLMRDGSPNHQAEFWAWQTIKTDPKNIVKNLPLDFLWGTATSAYQVEENCTNNDWSDLYPAGDACKHIAYFDQDITRMEKELGANAYRFSVEWSKIEPEEGNFEKGAHELERYATWCDKLNARGIKPVITLHHYTSPKWFAAKGGFAKAENIDCFVRFCTKVYERLHEKVAIWITFNAPSGYALQGFYRGKYAPFIEGGMGMAMRAAANILEAHVRIYQACKKIDVKPQIGILHHYYPLKMYSWLTPWDKLACNIGNSMNNDSTLEFFKSGKFSTTVPWVSHVNLEAPHCLDFIGLSFYSHGHLKNFSPGHHYDHELRTEKPNFVVYGEGLYHAIKSVYAALGKDKNFPLYVTENGVATADTADGDKLRETFMRRYLYAMSQAAGEGYAIKGYFYWSFMDNFEWIEKYTKQFGLYKVDFAAAEKHRTLRPSSRYYSDVVKESKKALSQ